MFIDGIAISNFRSFGDEPQEIGPFSRINVFVGQNNAGKSNILLFLQKHYKSFVENLNTNYSTDDYHLEDSKETKLQKIGIGITIDGEKYNTKIKEISSSPTEGTKQVKDFLSGKDITRGSKLAWFYYSSDGVHGSFSLSQEFIAKIERETNFNQYIWEQMFVKLTGENGSAPLRALISEVLARLSPCKTPSPTIAVIPAIRQIAEGNLSQFNGTSIYQRLAELQNPLNTGYETNKKRFELINEFVKDVTGNNAAEIEVPYDRQTILFHMNGKVLPLNCLGTGLHEVIIIAAGATLLSDQIVCIEEPELHLHPILQRKLINYLLEKTTNQYFITTHSNSFVNMNGVDVFHVTYDGRKTAVAKAISSKEKNYLLDDLGYQASDLLQTNYVLWVEGPSDRIYIRYWIEKMDKRLKEGIHYSIMFYGGRLRSHLSVSENEIEEFIKLNKINRNSGIIQDSDKKTKNDEIDKTKKRLIEEFTKMNYFNWLTAGREIENYIQEDVVKAAFTTVTKTELKKYGKYEKMTQYRPDTEKKARTVDKIQLAREITKTEPDLEVLDLKMKIEELVKKICEANKIEILKPEIN